MTFDRWGVRRRALLAAGALIGTLCGCSSSQTGLAQEPSPAVAAFGDTVEARTFDFFWSLSNPANGLTPDRSPTPSFSSVAAVGFALTAYPIGIDRGYVTRAAAAERVLTTLRFLWNAPQDAGATAVTGYHGFFYHFLDMQTGYRYQTVELSTIDTALLMAGVLFCRDYFDGPDPAETAIRELADSLYRRVDWAWAQARAPLISMGWTPEQGFHGYDYTGYNEAMILYILALGSPTHPATGDAWGAYTSSYQWGTFEGQEYVQFPPLFGYQYSPIWLDVRGIQDGYMRGHGIDYFENSRRAALAQRQYALENPMGWAGYGAGTWGLTASDGPGDFTRQVNGQSRQFHGYAARGAAATGILDDGTIAPTAAGGSVAFVPELALPALEAMRRRYGDDLFSTYGFRDAFNPSLTAGTTPEGVVVPGKGWFDDDYLGIDQGPIIAMLENYRSGLIWSRMRKDPYIIAGLRRAGFTGGWLDQAAAGSAP